MFNKGLQNVLLFYYERVYSLMGTCVVDFTLPITKTLFRLPKQCILPKVFNIKS